MYTCQTCLKEYTSQKRYLAHIERCEEQKDRSRTSNRSVASVAISDIEDDRSRSRSRSRVYSDSGGLGTPKSENTVDKLLKDKAKYKIEIKKYKQEIRDRIEEHRLELERVQEYFQEQIVSLTEERDDLSDQIFSEKERLRTEFVNKLNMEKKKLENRFGSKNSVALRLQTNVDKLQVQLQHQIEEKEMILDNHETQLSEMNDKHHLELETLKEELHNTRKMFDREREEIRKSQQLFQNEKEGSLSVLRREKDSEIQNVITEKDTIIQSLNHQISNLKRDKELQQRDLERAIVDVRSEGELGIQDRNRVIDRLKDTHNRALDQLKVHYDGKIFTLTEQMNKKIQEANDNREKDLAKKEYEHNSIVKNHIDNYNMKEEEFKQKITALDKQIVDIQDQHLRNTENYNRKNQDELKTITLNYENELTTLEQRLTKENKENNQERDETINELERLNHTLGAQVGHYRSAMDHMKADTDRLKEQFISNLNKQKHDDDKVIQEREQSIKEYENRIMALDNEHKKLQSHISSQLEESNNTIKKLEDKIKDKDEKYHELSERLIREESSRNALSQNYNRQLNESRDILTKKIAVEVEKVKNDYEHQLKVANEKLKEMEHNIHKADVHRANVSSIYETQIQQVKKEFEEKLNISESEIKNIQRMTENLLNKQRKEFTEQNKNNIIAAKKETAKEINDYKQKIDQLNQDLQQKQTKVSNIEKTLVINQKQIEIERENMNKERDELIKKAETPVRDTSAEEKLKKMRDDCIEALRKQKADLIELKTANGKLQEELSKIKNDNNKLKQENSSICETKKTMEDSALGEINKQQKRHDMLMKEKNDRIKELESLLNDAIRKITV